MAASQSPSFEAGKVIVTHPEEFPLSEADRLALRALWGRGGGRDSVRAAQECAR